jgi:hypothetical protein
MSRAGLAGPASGRRKMLRGLQATSRFASTRLAGEARSGRDHLRDSAAAAVNTLRAISDRSEAARAV